MAATSHPPRFTTRLLLALLVLVILTALSTGIPAYWLTRRQLEEQAWKNVHNAQQATRSLLQAESTRLADLATLFAERPTLEQLVQTAAQPDLDRYLQDFQAQSDLDILVVCQNGRPLAGNSPDDTMCSQALADGAYLLNGRPALLVTQTILRSSQAIGTTVIGRWLDNTFLQQLAAATGVSQSILLTDGTRLASSLSLRQLTAVPLRTDLAEQELLLDGEPYFAAYAPIGEPPAFVSEVALPVRDLAATEDQALLLLMTSTGLVAIAGMILGGLYLRQLVAPLQKLTQVADEISGGDLMAPIPLFSGPAEVSKLATALHQSQASMLQALAERSQARDRLNTLIQTIVEGVVTVTEDGRITFFSQGAETLTGWTAVEALGLSINTVFLMAESGDAPFMSQLPTLGSKRQIAIRGRDGQHIVLAVTGARLAANGNAAEIVLVLRDVTQEEALRHLRSYFLANISHEFRTPLSTLQASMELMLDEQENLSAAEMRQLLKPSYLSLSSLQVLIDNLLESGSVEAGQFVIQRRPFAITTVLSHAQQIVRPLLERRQQTIIQQLPPDLPVLEADPVRITQVLVNLLTNASKYSPLGTVITVQVVNLGAALRVMVTDEGVGIPPSERANVFHQFVRLDTTDREQVGIGLGLYIVKVVVEGHNGRVGVDDAPDSGSTFWFELPFTEDETFNR
ncbi:MAG: PAS domain S-box protein [Ardenticatenaceae bacterium]|nr:PAS domain S-box protein [Ardenticatenaceae bacterium]